MIKIEKIPKNTVCNMHLTLNCYFTFFGRIFRAQYQGVGAVKIESFCVKIILQIFFKTWMKYNIHKDNNTYLFLPVYQNPSFSHWKLYVNFKSQKKMEFLFPEKEQMLAEDVSFSLSTLLTSYLRYKVMCLKGIYQYISLNK